MGKFLRAISVRTGPLSLDIAHFVRDYCPNVKELYVTSAYRPGDPGHHGGLWYKASRTAAVDFGAYDDSEPNSKDQRDMGKAADWLFEHFWDLTVELIHTQPHNDHFTYVKNQKRVGAYAASTHVNHIHFATSRKLFKKMKARAKAKWGAPGSKPAPKPTPKPEPAPSTKYDDKESPIFGCDVYDFTVNDGLNEAAIREMVGRGGLKFINAKIAEMDRNGNTWVHTKALRMLNAAKEAGVEFPMGFVVPRTGVSPQALMNLATKALDQHCPWWRKHPTFSIQVDTERWGDYDSVSLDKGIQVAKYIRDEMKRRVVAIYAPDWGYEGSRGPISKVKAAGFGWWASEYAGSGASRNYKEMYDGAGGANGPGWRVVDGVKPVLNQFASDGRVPGYGGKLVVTAFNGTAHDFARHLGVDTTAPEEFEDMDKREFRENVKYAIAELLEEAAGGETKRGRWAKRRLRAIIVAPLAGKIAAVRDAVKELVAPTLPTLVVKVPEQELDVEITPDEETPSE